MLKQKKWYDASSKSLASLKIGDLVRLQHPVDKTWETTGTIIKIGRFRNYLVRLPNG